MVVNAKDVCNKGLSGFKDIPRRLFLRKDSGILQKEIQTNHELGRRSLTTIQLIGIGIGGTIGSGIYVFGGQAAANFAGPSIIISFIIGGIVALLSALSMAEMATLMPSSGSVFSYVYVAIGEYPAFMIGWLSTLLYLLGASIVVVRWSTFIVHFIDLISDYNTTSSLVEAPIAWSQDLETFYVTGQVINVPAIAITLIITIILILGIRETAIFNLVLVVIKVSILLVFIFACCPHVDRKNYVPFFPPNQGSFKQYGVTGMLYASTSVFFAYEGFETVTAVAQEARTPSRSMPYASIVPLIISILIYVGVSTVMVGLVPYNVLNTAYPLSEASKATPYGLWLPVVLTLGAIASLTTVAISVLLAQSRIFYAMAIDGLLPSIFAIRHEHTKTPWVSITICVDIIADVSSIGALITFLFIHICVIVLHYICDQPRPFKVPFGPRLIPIVGSILCLLLLLNSTRGAGIRFGVWMGIGHIIYFLYGFRRSNVQLEAKQKGAEQQINYSIDTISRY